MAPASAHDSRSTALLTRRRLLRGLCRALLCLTTSSSGQTRSLLQGHQSHAARALNVGQYDEVQTLLAARRPTSASVVLARARRDRAGPLRGRGKAAGRCRPASAPGSDAALELGLLQWLGRRGGRDTHTAGRADARARRTSPRGSWCGSGWRRARSAASRTRTASSATPAPRRPTTRRQHRVGRAVPREIQPRRRDEVVPGGAAASTRTTSRRAWGWRARCSKRTRRRRTGGRSACCRRIRTHVPAHLFDRGARARRSAARRGEASRSPRRWR